MTVQMGDVSKAKTVEDTCGLLQVVKHHETDELVDIHVAGPRAADMIPKATLAVKHSLTVDDISAPSTPSRRFGGDQTRVPIVPAGHLDDELLCRVDERRNGASVNALSYAMPQSRSDMRYACRGSSSIYSIN